MLPTQEYKAKRYGGSAKCPFCANPDAQNHFMQCTNTKIGTYWTTKVRDIRARLLKMHAHPLPLEAIINILHDWHTSQNKRIGSESTLIQTTLQDQAKIGWDAFVRGFWSKQWAHVQHKHYKQNQMVTKKRTGAIWFRNCLRIIWTSVHDVWQHHDRETHALQW